MKMTIPCVVALALLAGCDGFNGARADLYVSPRGSDAAASRYTSRNAGYSGA